MMTTVEQPIPNGKEKDHHREMCMHGTGEYMSTYVFPVPLSVHYSMQQPGYFNSVIASRNIAEFITAPFQYECHVSD